MKYNEVIVINDKEAKDLQASVKVCNGDTPYVDPVIFNDSSEIYAMDVCEDILGEYIFEVEENIYTVEVITESIAELRELACQAIVHYMAVNTGINKENLSSILEEKYNHSVPVNTLIEEHLMYNFVKNTDIDIFDTLFNVDVDLFHARREDRAITLDMVPAPIFIRTNYDNKNGILTATFKAMVKLTEIPVELELNEQDYYLFEVNDWEGISNTMVKIFEEAHRLAEQYKPGSTVEVRISGSHTKWVIVSEEGYWNNTDGWVEHKVDASTFDHTNYNLPIGQDCRWEQTTEGVSWSKMKPIFERTLSSLTYMLLRMALENKIFGESIKDRDYISNIREELELFVLHNSLCDEEVISHVKAVILEELDGGSYLEKGPDKFIQGLQEFLRDDLYASEEVQELFLSQAKEIAGDISGNE